MRSQNRVVNRVGNQRLKSCGFVVQNKGIRGSNPDYASERSYPYPRFKNDGDVHGVKCLKQGLKVVCGMPSGGGTHDWSRTLSAGKPDFTNRGVRIESGLVTMIIPIRRIVHFRDADVVLVRLRCRGPQSNHVTCKQGGDVYYELTRFAKHSS